METIKRQSELAAARVDAAAVGFDPITIITIITQVLPALLSCWNRNDSPEPVESAAKIRAYNSAHPVQLRKRTARRIRAEASRPMEKYQSLLLADAVIAQAMAADQQTAALCCVEAPDNL